LEENQTGRRRKAGGDIYPQCRLFLCIPDFRGQATEMKVVVLCSGGMDSVTALFWARQQHTVVGALSFDYGAKHNHREIPYAAIQAKIAGAKHTVIPLGFIGEKFQSDLLKSGGEIPEGHYAAENMKSTVVPFRNGIMLAVAGGLAESVGAEGLVIAAHGGDHAIYPDCREDFMRAMSDALRLGSYAGIQLLRPFIAMDKAQIVTEGTRLGVDFAQTWSCYKGGEIHCGKCGTCVERREAFQQAGVADPTRYQFIEPLPKAPKD
jgi:7-cyano-7-deazaguanine synthase